MNEAGSRVVTIKDEWTKTAADLLLQHEYRVTLPEWVPYCTCGWSAEDYCDVAAYDEHVARVVLEAVTPLIVEQALRDWPSLVGPSWPATDRPMPHHPKGHHQ